MNDVTLSRRLVLSGGLGAVTLTTRAARAQDATPDPAGEATPTSSPVSAAGGFLTSESPYIVATDPNALAVLPLITVGETLGDYEMAGTPDGLGAYRDGDEIVVFMNHELRPDEDQPEGYSRISRLTLDPATGAVTSAAYALDGTEGYQNLCSAFLAGPEVGFADRYYLTGEESASSSHGGTALALNCETGEVTDMPWIGLLYHENVVVIPGFADKTVVVTTDDDADGSELYLYVADSPEGVLSGDGQLHVFVADNAAGTADIRKGDELTGRLVPIDQENNSDQDVLQAAANDLGAFAFVRLEDVTYDRTDTTTIYFTDCGDDGDGNPLSLNGRLYAMSFDPADPTSVTSFRVLLDGDDGDDIKNPDNLDATATTLMICEDRNGPNRFENSEDTGRILAYDLASGELTTIARIDQSPRTRRLVPDGGRAGEWESSGILDVSEFFGAGSWLVTVQAHTRKVEQFGGENDGGQLLLLRER